MINFSNLRIKIGFFDMYGPWTRHAQQYDRSMRFLLHLKMTKLFSYINKLFPLTQMSFTRFSKNLSRPIPDSKNFNPLKYPPTSSSSNLH